jgi:signal transduction histidine kinase
VPAFTRRWQWVVGDAATWRDLAWLLLDPLAAALLVLPPLALAGYGLWALAWQSVWTALGFGDGGGRAGGYGAVVDRPWLAVPLGIALVVLGAVLAPTAVRLHSRWARALLAPTERARLAQRVQQLAETRADATDAQAAELRRIERDLHDGAQARLVAVGLSLGTIEQLMDRDPEAAKALLAQARETSARALAELRDLVRGVHPPVLAERGLVDAIRALALDSPLPVTVDVDLPVRSEPPVEAAAYFAVAEMLANAARHSGARSVRVDLRNAEDRLRITVADDGQGGADPARGSGLRGIQRRLGTFDGTMTVASPPGGPTTVTMEIPCALSSPRTSTS